MALEDTSSKTSLISTSTKVVDGTAYENWNYYTTLGSGKKSTTNVYDYLVNNLQSAIDSSCTWFIPSKDEWTAYLARVESLTSDIGWWSSSRGTGSKTTSEIVYACIARSLQ